VCKREYDDGCVVEGMGRSSREYISNEQMRCACDEKGTAPCKGRDRDRGDVVLTLEPDSDGGHERSEKLGRKGEEGNVCARDEKAVEEGESEHGWL
jgi:hypothetical protein